MMIEESLKKIEFKENSDTIKDILRISNKEEIKNENYIRVVDADTGRVLIERKKNIITLRGRTFALEKLYENTNNSPSYPTKNYNRKINLFSVGTGGCPVGDPFSPILPSPLDVALADRVPFITLPVGSNPTDIYPDISMTNYPVAPELVGDNNLYYYKIFNILEPEWFIDLNTNTTYEKVELLVDMEDCRNENLNELSLFFSTNTHTEPEMYSRVTFPTEHISGNKRIVVEYYTFA